MTFAETQKETDLKTKAEQPGAPSTKRESEAPKLSFETALEKLQAAVKKLESGELTLEQSLKEFEDGVRLTRVCQEHLSSAEQRVEILMKTGADGQIQTQPFSPSRTPSSS